jgi:ectoine hydroxylase-related dioxygenase (phytanoyl-CoA dioxygenase family)
LGNWNCKAGATHVEPPMALLSCMITVRGHLDPVDADNAPLLIAPGSHREGRIRETLIAEVVAERGQAACLAAAGDAWLYATPILHASEAAVRPRARRVLQVRSCRREVAGRPGLGGGMRTPRRVAVRPAPPVAGETSSVQWPSERVRHDRIDPDPVVRTWVPAALPT